MGLLVIRRFRARIFRQGVVTNVLNPKVGLFFLAFLPQFVDPTRGPVALQILALGLIFNTSGTIVNVGVAWLAGSLRARIESGVSDESDWSLIPA